MSAMEFLTEETMGFDKPCYDEGEQKFYERRIGSTLPPQDSGANTILQDIAGEQENIQMSLAGPLSFCRSTMGPAYELCNELFSWIDKQEQCAEDLMVLADELGEITKAKSKLQLLKNTFNVMASFSLLVVGLTFLSVLPPLGASVGVGGCFGFVLLACVSSGLSTLIGFTHIIVKKWKSSKAMENAEKTADEMKKILNNIERLQQKLTEECEIQGLKASSSNEVQCEITARILKAMAKQKEKDLPLNCLRHLLRNEDKGSVIHLEKTFFRNVSVLLTVIGYSFFALKTITQTDQVTEGVLGLVLTLPDLVNNCEKLIKNKHQPEAINFLKTKADEICKEMEKLKTSLNGIQEILCQMECDIDLVGSEIYKEGTIYIKYKDIKVPLEKYIVMCSTDIGQKDGGATCSSGKRKLNGKKQSEESTLSEDSTFDGVYKRKKCTPEPNPPDNQTTGTIEIKDLNYRLPQITLSNVNSLPNKMIELKELLRKTQDESLFYKSDLIFFTETCLKKNAKNLSIPGYGRRRIDRNQEKTYKGRGGGLIAYIKNEWSKSIERDKSINTPHYELMSLLIKPNNHPKDSPPLIFILVYVHTWSTVYIKDTKERLHEIYQHYLDSNIDAPIFLLGDFNQCELSLKLQYVTCNTRLSNTLDKCYGNVPNAYTCVCSRPLGKSDHNVIHLLPNSDKNSPCNHVDITKHNEDEAIAIKKAQESQET